MSALTGLRYFRFRCYNLERTRHFYCNGLSLHDEIVRDKERDILLLTTPVLEDDDNFSVTLRFELEEDKRREEIDDSSYLLFYVKNVARVVTRLAAQGYEPEVEPEKQRQITIVPFIDPNGLRIRIVQAAEDKMLRVPNDTSTLAWSVRIAGLVVFNMHAEQTVAWYTRMFAEKIKLAAVHGMLKEMVVNQQRRVGSLSIPTSRRPSSALSGDAVQVPRSPSIAGLQAAPSAVTQARRPSELSRRSSGARSEESSLSAEEQQLNRDVGEIGLHVVDQEAFSLSRLKYIWLGIGDRQHHPTLCFVDKFDEKRHPQSCILGIGLGCHNVEMACRVLAEDKVDIEDVNENPPVLRARDPIGLSIDIALFRPDGLASTPRDDASTGPFSMDRLLRATMRKQQSWRNALKGALQQAQQT